MWCRSVELAVPLVEAAAVVSRRRFHWSATTGFALRPGVIILGRCATCSVTANQVGIAYVDVLAVGLSEEGAEVFSELRVVGAWIIVNSVPQ